MAAIERGNWDKMFVMDHQRMTELAQKSGIALLSFNDIATYLGPAANPNNWILFDVLPRAIDVSNRGVHW